MDETIKVPRPHVIYGPEHVSAEEADADYLRSAARNLRHLEQRGQSAFGSNLTNTVVKLLEDAAVSIGSIAPTSFSDGDPLIEAIDGVEGAKHYNVPYVPTSDAVALLDRLRSAEARVAELESEPRA